MTALARIEKGFSSGEISVVLNWEGVPPVDICHYLKTFLVEVMVVVVVGFATGISWAETRGADKYPTLHRTTPQQRILQLRMSAVLRARNPD